MSMSTPADIIGFLAGNPLPSPAQVDRIIRLCSAYERAKIDAGRQQQGKLSSDILGSLAKNLVDCYAGVNPRDSYRRHGAVFDDCCFTCKMCDSLCNDPLTIPCGHTFCRACLEKDPGKCVRCGAVFDMKSESMSALKTNILLLKTIEKWFPGEAKAVKLKNQGNLLFSQKKFETAAGIYSKAIDEVMTDHLLFSNRSFVFVVLARHQEALQDAETVIRLKPDWPKGYYRKGAALSGLLRHKDAMMAYLECLVLDPSLTAVQSALKKVLEKILIHNIPREKTQEKAQEKPSSSWLQDLIQGNNGFLYPRSTTSQRPPSPTAMSPSSPFHSSSPSSLHLSTKPMTSADRISLLLSSRKRSHDCVTEKAPVPTKITKPSTVDAVPATNPTISSCLRCKGMASKARCKEDFECSLCFRLMYKPVTTPCGHSFCLECLYRCLDYRITCPLCKSSLTQYLAERRKATTLSVDLILQTYFPEDTALRKKQHDSDMEEFTEITNVGTSLKHKIPIFVCALAYPMVPCPLHIFEPRNRLMIRRCFESPGRQFGMCITLEGREDHYEEYGCLLRIRNQQYLPDGRSVLDTIGGPRFRVVNRSVKDGYYVSDVEFVKDTPVETSRREELQQLNNAVYTEAKRWFESLPPVPHTRILQHFGAFPMLEEDIFVLSDGAAWVWWLTAVLPIDKRAQYSILAMLSLRERLVSLHKFIMAINRRWIKQ